VRKLYLNGRISEASAAHIDPADRGLLLADGLFETLRAYDGRLFRLEAHLARLAAGAVVLGLPLPPVGEIAAAAKAVLQANDLLSGSLRITVTRGRGPRGLLPPTSAEPTLMIAAAPLPASLPEAMSAHLVGLRRNEHSPLSRLKSLAYLDNILALREADAAGCAEAILLNTAGRIACGSRSNLFLVLDGALVTAPVSEGVLPGIARQTVIELASERGIPVKEVALPESALTEASEAFLTNSLIELVALDRIDGRALPEGPVTARLRQLYRQATATP
jgi:branched-chain amino acid aminotransferase